MEGLEKDMATASLCDREEKGHAGEPEGVKDTCRPDTPDSDASDDSFHSVEGEDRGLPTSPPECREPENIDESSENSQSSSAPVIEPDGEDGSQSCDHQSDGKVSEPPWDELEDPEEDDDSVDEEYLKDLELNLSEEEKSISQHPGTCAADDCSLVLSECDPHSVCPIHGFCSEFEIFTPQACNLCMDLMGAVLSTGPSSDSAAVLVARFKAVPSHWSWSKSNILQQVSLVLAPLMVEEHESQVESLDPSSLSASKSSVQEISSNANDDVLLSSEGGPWEVVKGNVRLERRDNVWRVKVYDSLLPEDEAIGKVVDGVRLWRYVDVVESSWSQQQESQKVINRRRFKDLQNILQEFSEGEIIHRFKNGEPQEGILLCQISFASNLFRKSYWTDDFLLSKVRQGPDFLSETSSFQCKETFVSPFLNSSWDSVLNCLRAPVFSKVNHVHGLVSGNLSRSTAKKENSARKTLLSVLSSVLFQNRFVDILSSVANKVSSEGPILNMLSSSLSDLGSQQEDVISYLVGEYFRARIKARKEVLKNVIIPRGYSRDILVYSKPFSLPLFDEKQIKELDSFLRHRGLFVHQKGRGARRLSVAFPHPCHPSPSSSSQSQAYRGRKQGGGPPRGGGNSRGGNKGRGAFRPPYTRGQKKNTSSK